MGKHSASFTGTAKVNLFPQVFATIDDLLTAPVGTIVRNADGDKFQRQTHGMWRGTSIAHRIDDAELTQYLPLAVENHDDLSGLELGGFYLGDLVKVLTSEYALAAGAGSKGVIERIVGAFLYVRFKGGVVVPLHPHEIEVVRHGGVHLHAQVEVTEAIFPHGPLGKGATGYVIGRQPGHIEPHYLVRVEGDSPWFARANAWVYPQSALKSIS